MPFKELTVNKAPEEAAYIYAEDDAAIYESIFGGNGVTSLGKKLNLVIVSNNKVRIEDGVACVGGHIGRIPFGDYEECEIDSGESGKNRNDIVMVRYETDGTGGISRLKVLVKKGEPGLEARDPEIVEGSAYENEPISEMALYRLVIEGLNIVKVEPMFRIIKANEEFEKELAELNSKLSVTITASNGLTYERYGDGKMRVYGRVTTEGSTSAAVINLAIPFRDAYYTVQVTPEYLSSYPAFNASAQITTASRFNIYTRKVDGSLLGGVKVHVLLEGRWK